MNAPLKLLPLDYQGPEQIHFEAMPKTVLANSVWHRFMAVANVHGERLAMSDLTESLTYTQLVQNVLALAAHLTTTVKFPTDTPIALFLPHTVKAPIAMLACLAVGVPYVPLDPTFPLQRNRDIIRHSLAGLILTDTTHLAVCQDIAPAGCTIIVLDKLSTPTHALAFSDFGAARSIGYILYTSGSTGQPKGVYQNQRGMLHDVLQYVNSVHITPSDRLTMLYSSSVVGAVRDIFAALLMGASVHLLPVKTLGVSGVLTQIQQKRISILHAVPVLFRQLTQDNAAKSDFTGIRLLYLAGDRLDKADAELFQTLFDSTCFLYTGIGSTENATIYRQWFISTTTQLSGFKTLPVGRAISDRTVRIIDEDGHSLPCGEIGEIEVTSRYMALGYWQNELLTQKSFLQCKTDPQARVFRTGDLGSEQQDGLLLFYGRKDARVKIRGYLIAPADIEVTAKTYSRVHEAAVLIRRNAQGDTCNFVLYWQGEAELTEMALRHYLSTQLSLPQMPARCFKLKALPMLENFKIDRQKLALLDNVSQVKAPEKVEYASDTTGRVLRVLAEVMTQPSVSLNDNLETLYADSLDVLRIILALEHEFNIMMDTERFYANFATVAALSAFIDLQHNEIK